jgi:hypothetical protein
MSVSQPAIMAESHGSAACSNCGAELLGDFCHRCGEQKRHADELTLKHFFLHATHDLTHLDTKIFATLRYLLTRPGFLTQEFIAGRRTRYMRPFSLFLVACAVFFLADSIRPTSGYDVHQLAALDKSGRMDAAWEKLAKAKHVPKEIIIERVQETMHRASTAAQIVNALAVAVALALLFHRHYFVEHLVLSLHFLSFTYIASVLLLPLNFMPARMNMQSMVVSIGVTLLFMAYLFASMRRIYGQGAVATFFKMIITYGVTQAMIIVTVCAALVLAVVRAAKAH